MKSRRHTKRWRCYSIQTSAVRPTRPMPCRKSTRPVKNYFWPLRRNASVPRRRRRLGRQVPFLRRHRTPRRRGLLGPLCLPNLRVKSPTFLIPFESIHVRIPPKEAPFGGCRHTARGRGARGRLGDHHEAQLLATCLRILNPSRTYSLLDTLTSTSSRGS